MTEADARARMAAQATREERLAVADIVLRNDGDLADLAAPGRRGCGSVLDARARRA